MQKNQETHKFALVNILVVGRKVPTCAYLTSVSPTLIKAANEKLQNCPSVKLR